MYTSTLNMVLILSTSKWTFVLPQTFVVGVYTGCCHHKSSHRMLPSHLGVGGNVQSLDVCTYTIGCCNQTIVHARSLYIYFLSVYCFYNQMFLFVLSGRLCWAIIQNIGHFYLGWVRGRWHTSGQ